MDKQDSGSIDRQYNRDDDLKVPSGEGGPPRPATEPRGAEKSTRSKKTATDPVTGEPNR